MEIRHLKPDEMNQAVRLSDRIFRETGHTSMAEAFPQVFTKGVIHSFGAFDGRKLVSFIGLVPGIIKIGSSDINVFSLGSVCTDEAYRGKGISTSIINQVYQYIDEAGASLLFVSGDRGMYLRNNCYHFGEIQEFSIHKENLMKTTYTGNVRRGNKHDIFAVNQLTKTSEVRFESSLWEWSVLLESSGLASISKEQQVLYVAENTNDLEAYVVISLNNEDKTEKAFVTEWRGDLRAVHAILGDILRSNITEEIVFHIPWYEDNTKILQPYFREKKPHGGTIHLINETSLLKQIKNYLNQRCVEELAIIRRGKDSFSLQFGDDSIDVTQAELIASLFIPNTDFIPRNSNLVLPIPLPNTEGMYFV